MVVAASENVKPVNQCAYCGKPLESYRMRYCSALCHNLYWFRVYEEHLARPGVRPNIPGAWDYIKIAKINAASKTCERCGLTFDEFKLQSRAGFKYGISDSEFERYLRYLSPVSFLDCHHIVPLYKGGNSSFENLMVLCKSCHKLTHQRMPGKKNPIKIKREDTRQMKLF